MNGWQVIKSAADPRLRTIKIPGTNRKVTVRRVAAPLFAAYLADWNAKMTPRLKLDKGPLDGWQFRKSRFNSNYSNHASATAIDCRYDVLKADQQRHMTKDEIGIVHGILNIYVDDKGRRVFAWGGDWQVGKYCDEMHTELAQAWADGAKGRATTKADVKAVIKRLGIKRNGVRTK